jgi:hypothetical protein
MSIITVKEKKMRRVLKIFCGLAVITWAMPVLGWTPDSGDKLEVEVGEAIATIKEKDPNIKKFFETSSAYAVFPGVAKGAMGIGAAHGDGILIEGGKTAGDTSVTQVTVGFQLGGQVYSEFVFFKDATAVNDFKRGNFEFDAQASAVAVTAGASADAGYNGGVAIFTMAKGGLMYEASVGGQKFKYESK